MRGRKEVETSHVAVEEGSHFQHEPIEKAEKVEHFPHERENSE